MEAYLEGNEPDERRRCAPDPQGHVLACAFFPVFCGSAFKNKGVQPLLDASSTILPSPLDVPADQGHRPEDETRNIERQAMTPSRCRCWRSRS
jgi:elongation factor G